MDANVDLHRWQTALPGERALRPGRRERFARYRDLRHAEHRGPGLAISKGK